MFVIQNQGRTTEFDANLMKTENCCLLKNQMLKSTLMRMLAGKLINSLLFSSFQKFLCWSAPDQTSGVIMLGIFRLAILMAMLSSPPTSLFKNFFTSNEIWETKLYEHFFKNLTSIFGQLYALSAKFS